MKLPKKCYDCVWSWGDTIGEEWCKLCLDPDTCEGPREIREVKDGN